MTATDGEIAVLIGYMPQIVRSAGITDLDRKFCASIIAQSRRGRFTPSPRQIAIMRRLKVAFQDATMRDDPITEPTP